MRVISQTGKTDVSYENFVFSILNSSGGNYGNVKRNVYWYAYRNAEC